MQSMKMRPTFAISLPATADNAMEQIRIELENLERSERSISVGRHAELFVAKEDRRIWSPHLSIQVEEAESGSQLRGRFSPRPEIWTLLMFCYTTLISLAFFGAMFGCAQWMIDQQPWGLIAVPVILAIIVGLHLASLIGQRLSDDQMRELRTRLDAILRAAFGINPSD